MTRKIVLAALGFIAAAIAVVMSDSGGHVPRMYHSARDYPSVMRFVALFVPLGLIVAWLMSRRKKEHPRTALLTRRAFLASSAAGSVALLYGNRVGRYELGLTRRRVAIRNLPPELSGLKVGLLADLHCGYHNDQDYLRSAIARINDCAPDLILVPGDLISYNLANAPRAAELLKALRPGIPGGLLFSWGNHDHWHGLADHPEQLSSTGATLLLNEHRVLTRERKIESTGSGLWIVGVDDLWAGEPDLSKALHGVPDDQPRLVLCHNPDLAELEPHHRVDLMLSGHTHGGQVRFPLLGAPVVPSNFGQKYAQGWVEGPGYPVYVTRGVGVGGIPVRLGVPPEVALLELYPS